MAQRFLRAVAIACGLILACGLTASRGFGQTYGIDFRNTLMPASGGMAGTSVAAPQDFISAINANPAALTQYRGTNFTLGGAFAEATVNLTQTAPVPALGVAPFSAKSSTPGAIVPAIGVAHRRLCRRHVSRGRAARKRHPREHRELLDRARLHLAL